MLGGGVDVDELTGGVQDHVTESRIMQRSPGSGKDRGLNNLPKWLWQNGVVPTWQYGVKQQVKLIKGFHRCPVSDFIEPT